MTSRVVPRPYYKVGLEVILRVGFLCYKAAMEEFFQAVGIAILVLLVVFGPQIIKAMKRRG